MDMKPPMSLERPLGDAWSFDEVKAWMMKHAAPGLIVIAEETQGGAWRYLPAEILRIREKPWKMDVEAATPLYPQSPTYWANGKSSWHPKGRTRILPPFQDAVQAAIKAWTWYMGRPAAIGHYGCQTPGAEALREKLAQQTVIAAKPLPSHQG